jgi:EmrB/QacA subfamily drug resistance transporter
VPHSCGPVRNAANANDDSASRRFTLPELSSRRRYLVLAICCLSLFLVGMDATIINVALPSIGHDFRAPVSGLQWTVDAYMLVVASLLMLSGSVGDRIGRRRVFQAGLALFTVGSLACSLAPGLGWLIGFRALQAVGGSMLNPVAMAIVTNTFTDPRERAKAIGLWGSVFGLSVALGPVIGGALVDSTGWRSIFWVNVPVGIVGFILAAKYVPDSRAAVARRLDPVGQVLIMVLLGTLTTAIIEGPDHGWSSPLIIGLFAAAVAAVAGLLAWEPRRAQPLIDLRFFRSLPFSGAALTAITGMAAFSGFLFLITLYLQEVRGYRPLEAGLFLLPMALIMAVSAPLCGAVMSRIGSRVPLLIAGTGIAAAGVALSFVTAASPAWCVLCCGVILGIGMGWLNAPITNNAVSGMPRAQAGVAAGIASTSRQVGSSLGVAIGGSVLAANLHGPLASGFTAATRPAWWIVAAMGACVAVMAVATTGRAGRSSARQAAELIEFSETPAAAAPAPARAA